MPKSIVIFGFHAIQAQLESNPECLLNNALMCLVFGEFI
jgi:hypothetical protein